MRPISEIELSEMLAATSSAICIKGGGTRNMSVQGDTLDVSALSGVTLYEPGALTIVAKGGTPLAEIENALAAENQRLAFEPADYRALLGTKGEPTLGAVAAGNLSGPRRIQVGAARDFMLGVRLVDGTGTVIKNGGRVMKNVTGYDLVKLMSGAWGTLGVLTEISLKVLPQTETSATLVLHGLSDTDAVQAMSAALGSPFDVSGAAHLPFLQRTQIRVEGFADSVAYRTEQLQAHLGRFGTIDVATGDTSASWSSVRDAHAFQNEPGDVWRISVKPSDAPELVASLEAEQVVYDWGGGLVWVRMPPNTDVRSRMAGVAGHATLVRAASATIDRLGRFHPEPEAIARLADGLRQRFDPKGILNPGLMHTITEA